MTPGVANNSPHFMSHFPKAVYRDFSYQMLYYFQRKNNEKKKYIYIYIILKFVIV